MITLRKFFGYTLLYMPFIGVLGILPWFMFTVHQVLFGYSAIFSACIVMGIIWFGAYLVEGE